MEMSVVLNEDFTLYHIRPPGKGQAGEGRGGIIKSLSWQGKVGQSEWFRTG